MKFIIPIEAIKQYKSKQWPQYLVVLTAGLIAFSCGLHFAWPSPSLPILLSEDYPLEITSEEASYIAVIGPLGDIVGAPIAAILAERIGRKNGILMTTIPLLISWLIIAFANSSLTFCIGRFIGGIGDGFLYIIFPMYVGEVTEPKNRGVLGCSLSVTGIVGSLAMNAYAPYLSIQTTAFISACFPVLALVTFMWMPESPYYLLMKGKIDEARKSLYFLRRCDIEKDLEVLKNDVDRQMSERGTWKDIFYIKSNRKAMLIMMGIRTVQQMSGISAWGLFTQTIFVQADGNMSPILSTCIYLFTQLIMTSCGSVLIDKYGRKPLLIFSCVGAGAVLNIGGIYFYLKEVTDFDTSSLNWIPIVVMVSFVIIFSIGLGTVPSLMLGELFSASIKGKGLCIMCIYYSLLISIFSKLFYYLTESYGMFASFFMFGMMSFFSVIFSYYFVPVLLSEDSHLNITSDEASYIVIIQPLGDIIGAPTAALLADIIGRKKGLLLLAIPTFVSWIFIAFAQNTLMICIGRFISGIGDGFLFIMYPMYVGEVTEPKIRGVLGCSLSLAMIVGMISINSYAPFLSIQNAALVSSIFPIIAIVCFILMPESPYYLLMKGKVDEAKKSLNFLRRCNVEEELETLNKDVQRQVSERGKLQDLFCIDSNRKALFIMLGIRSAQQFSGISAWSLFTQTIFIEAGAGSPLTSTLVYLVVQLAMTTCGSVLLEKYGRKPLLIISSIGAGIVLNIGGIYFYLKEMTDYDTSLISWMPIVVMICFIVIYSVGLGTVPSLMLSEMFSASIKGKALCVMCIYYAAMISITSKLFHFLTVTFGMYVSFFTFGIACFVSVLFSYYFVPETKGKSLEDIQQYLKGNYVKE